MRLGAARAALATAALVGGLAVPGAAGAAPEPELEKCEVKGGSDIASYWPLQRLHFDRAWPLTRGAKVIVGVVDTGLNKRNRQLTGMRTEAGISVIPVKAIPRTDTTDCDGHGTAVSSIIAAQPKDGVPFAGVAPDATILPIRQTYKQDDDTGTSQTIGAGLAAAVNRGAKVVNISITTSSPTDELENAVRLAALRDVVVVAAAGNDRQNQANSGTKPGPAYPAAYSTKYPNVIAVSASDQNDGVAPFSNSGSYVSVAAPGVALPAAAANTQNGKPDGKDGYVSETGTSFAAPLVTGVVALLRARFGKSMSAAQVRNRIEATADPPPATVPSPLYGYGIVNPYLALTTDRNDSPRPSDTRRAAPLPPQAKPPEADRHLQDLSLALAAGMLGLVLLVFAATAVLRARGRRPVAARAN